ncbi:uncharacterized protein LOC144142412 [Haemaphysalis longicornis]
MAPRSPYYTLFGYSRDLDWRPTCFVDPVPTVRVCSLCGLVPDATAQLPCAHFMCRPCYEGCLRLGGVCALDGQAFGRDDAEWISLSLENFMRKKVCCWNEVNGCDAVAEVSKIADHFSNECAFHAASCSQCGAVVLHRDVVDHLRSGCRLAVVPRRAPLDLPADTLSQTESATIDSETEKALQEATAALEEVSAKNESLEADLKELKELLAQSFAALAAMEKNPGPDSVEASNGSQKRNSAKQREMNSASSGVKQLREGIGEVLKAWRTYQLRYRTAHADETIDRDARTRLDVHAGPLRPTTACSSSSSHEWCVMSYASLKEVALRDGKVDAPSSPGYFFGYRIEPIIRFKKHDKGVRMHMGLQVLRGDNDQHLLWPFHHHVRLWVVVPSGDARITWPLEMEPGAVDDRAYARPCEGSRGNGPCISTTSIDLAALEAGQYVANDRLRLRFEVLP